MTAQELREKIVEVIRKRLTELVGSCRTDKIPLDSKSAEIVMEFANELADALIVAVVGDVKEAKFESDHFWRMWQGALVELERAEHRAEVAEKEIEEYKEKIKYGKFVEPVWFISHMNGLPCYGRVIGYQEDSGFVIEGTDCLISAEKIYLSEEQAEKELQEEKKYE